MIYPAISSTASRGGFKLIYARSFRPTLAFECIRRASQLEPDERLTFLRQLSRYRGLSAIVDKNYWFLAGQRKRATESRVKTTDGESVISIVESSTDEAEEEEEVEISTACGDFKSKVKRQTSASEALNVSSSSDSDYGRFRDGFGSTEGQGKRRRRTSKATKNKKSEGDSSDSSDFFEPNGKAVTKSLPTAAAASYTATTKWTVTSRKKFRLGSQKK